MGRDPTTKSVSQKEYVISAIRDASSRPGKTLLDVKKFEWQISPEELALYGRRIYSKVERMLLEPDVSHYNSMEKIIFGETRKTNRVLTFSHGGSIGMGTTQNKMLLYTLEWDLYALTKNYQRIEPINFILYLRLFGGGGGGSRQRLLIPKRGAGKELELLVA